MKTKSIVRRPTVLRCLGLMIMLAVTSCARGDAAPMTIAVTKAAAIIEQDQSPATTIQGFTQVEGADLNARLEAARNRARSNQSPYWSAWAFDVRSGVAVDPNLQEFHGSMNTYGDTAVFFGTSASGMTVETRNLAVFVLRAPASNQVTRIEVYNLERKREYAGYPVYWLGRANNEESLNYLRPLVEGAPPKPLAERATLAIALHDDARVAQLLKNFIRTSTNAGVRSSATYWLGQVGGEQPFLAEIVRNTSEDLKLRRTAAYSIGGSRDRAALATVQSLYEAVTERDLRRSLIHSVAGNEDKDNALAFLLKVARKDPDNEARRTAVRAIGQRGEASIDVLLKLYDTEQNLEVRRTVVQSLGAIKSPRVEDKLFQVASSDQNIELRRQAIRALGERAGQRTLQFLSDTAEKADGDTEVQVQAVRAISQRPKDESVPILIRIARTHQNQAVRRQAIRSLGESGDPRAVEFFREVLAK